MSRECPVCHHAMTAALVRHVQTWHDTVVVFENVPAEVCEQCGEQLLTGAVVDQAEQPALVSDAAHTDHDSGSL